MAANPAPGAEYFTAPRHPNQRRYEALRAYFTEGLTVEQAGARAGYTRSSMASLLRDFRAGKLELFAPPGRPGPKTAPAKDRARARVLELRRAGLSVHEISARLRAGGTPLNRTGVGQILAGEGFGLLLRSPAPEASASPATAGRDTRLPRAAVTDFAAFPARAETRLAGLLLAVPDLVALDLPALTSKAGYPGTSVIPAVSWLLSLLALKLTGTRRVSHVDDLLTDPASALFAGLAVLPKKSALTDYSYRLAHDHQQQAGQTPDPKAAQIDRMKTDISKLKDRLAQADQKITDLAGFRSQALARLAAQHEEIIRLREHASRTSRVTRLPAPRTTATGTTS